MAGEPSAEASSASGAIPRTPPTHNFEYGTDLYDTYYEFDENNPPENLPPGRAKPLLPGGHLLSTPFDVDTLAREEAERKKHRTLKKRGRTSNASLASNTSSAARKTRGSRTMTVSDTDGDDLGPCEKDDDHGVNDSEQDDGDARSNRRKNPSRNGRKLTAYRVGDKTDEDEGEKEVEEGEKSFKVPPSSQQQQQQQQQHQQQQPVAMEIESDQDNFTLVIGNTDSEEDLPPVTVAISKPKFSASTTKPKTTSATTTHNPPTNGKNNRASRAATELEDVDRDELELSFHATPSTSSTSGRKRKKPVNYRESEDDDAEEEDLLAQPKPKRTSSSSQKPTLPQSERSKKKAMVVETEDEDLEDFLDNTSASTTTMTDSDALIHLSRSKPKTSIPKTSKPKTKSPAPTKKTSAKSTPISTPKSKPKPRPKSLIIESEESEQESEQLEPEKEEEEEEIIPPSRKRQAGATSSQKKGPQQAKKSQVNQTKRTPPMARVPAPAKKKQIVETTSSSSHTSTSSSSTSSDDDRDLVLPSILLTAALLKTKRTTPLKTPTRRKAPSGASTPIQRPSSARKPLSIKLSSAATTPDQPPRKPKQTKKKTPARAPTTPDGDDEEDEQDHHEIVPETLPHSISDRDVSVPLFSPDTSTIPETPTQPHMSATDFKSLIVKTLMHRSVKVYLHVGRDFEAMFQEFFGEGALSDWPAIVERMERRSVELTHLVIDAGCRVKIEEDDEQFLIVKALWSALAWIEQYRLYLFCEDNACKSNQLLECFWGFLDMSGSFLLLNCGPGNEEDIIGKDQWYDIVLEFQTKLALEAFTSGSEWLIPYGLDRIDDCLDMPLDKHKVLKNMRKDLAYKHYCYELKGRRNTLLSKSLCDPDKLLLQYDVRRLDTLLLDFFEGALLSTPSHD
ncbi:hypothetical protein HDU97_002368 [Phlyctochytrium planicorne]|nr:hypothetical protein HDU97_002368 [Phlyctochytrium planicorne]